MHCDCEAFQSLEDEQIAARERARKEHRIGWPDEEATVIGEMLDHMVKRPCQV